MSGGRCTAFDGHRRMAAGPLPEVAAAVRDAGRTVLVFDDADGRVVDLDPRESIQDLTRRLRPEADAGVPEAAAPRGPGRPKLGVVAREVTLLPRHWEWLNAQPGGASAALRRLVEAARKQGGEAERERRRRDAAYRFMSALAGDLPGYEEATRALFAGDRRRFEDEIAGWPGDVRDYAAKLAFGGDEGDA